MKEINSLVHFSFIQESLIKTNDVLEGILPLFAPLLDEKKGEIFNASDFSNKVQEVYGLDIHPYVIESFALKFKAKGWLTQAGGMLTYSMSSISTIEKKELVDNEIQELVSDFERVHLAIYPEDESKKINFRDQMHLIMSKHKLSSDENSDLEKRLSYSFSKLTLEYDLTKGSDNIISSIYAGIVISQVILSLNEPLLDEAFSLENTLVIIDTPIILSALGFHGKIEEALSRKFLVNLHNLKAKLTTTELYKKEAQESIKMALENHKNKSNFGSRTKIDKTFKTQENMLPKAVAVLKSTDEALGIIKIDMELSKQINIQLESKRSQELNQDIYSQLYFHQNDRARENDSVSIAATVIKNGHQFKERLAQYDAIYVTSNQSIVTHCNNHFKRQDYFKHGAVSPIVTDRDLATLIWIKNGSHKSKIDTISILPQCLQVTNYIKFKYAEFIERLAGTANEEDSKLYLSVLTSDSVLDSLIQNTNASVDFIRDGDLKEFIEQTIEKIGDEKANQVKDTYQQRLSSEIAQRKMVEEVSKNEIIELKKEVSKYQSIINGRILEAKETAVKKANNAVTFLKIAIAIVLFSICQAGTYAANLMPNSLTGTTLYIISTLAIPFLLTWKIPDLVFSKRIKAYEDKIIKREEDKIKKQYQDVA